MSMKIIGNEWDDILSAEFKKPYYQKLRTFLDDEYQHHTIYPKASDLYNALRFTPYNDVKVVILGQDPYHEPNQAFGFCFAVSKGVALPPSLKNIYKELASDLNIPPCHHGDLRFWAKQGVLLLNTVLTVRAHQANSHANHGWEILTDEIIKKLNQKAQPIVFILWGNNARSKKVLIDNPRHLIIESAHPSPLSAYHGFFGSKPFSKTNAFLLKNQLSTINWKLPE